MAAFADHPLEPFSDHYGLDRGTPLDRRYIEAFLEAHRDAVRGSVLEVQDDAYTRRFGGDRVSTSTVVDIDRSNPQATLIADLSESESLPAAAFDCVIVTQTLHLLRRPGVCIEACHRALRAGGVLLVTAPALSRLSPRYPDGDYWRFTAAGLAELFEVRWPGSVSIESFGNLRTCVGFLMGEVVEELSQSVLDEHDPRFPLTVAAAATR